MFFGVFRPPDAAGHTSPATGKVAWKHLECEARASLAGIIPALPWSPQNRAGIGFQGMAPKLNSAPLSNWEFIFWTAVAALICNGTPYHPPLQARPCHCGREKAWRMRLVVAHGGVIVVRGAYCMQRRLAVASQGHEIKTRPPVLASQALVLRVRGRGMPLHALGIRSQGRAMKVQGLVTR